MKRLALGTLALVAAFAGMAGSASALGTYATCAIGGATGPLTPPVQLQGSSGSFSFSGNVACQVNLAPAIGTISASGGFTNSVCGTGSADGVVTAEPSNTRVGTPFHIDFTAGNGLVYVGADGNGDGKVDSSVGNLAGDVQLLPTGPSILRTLNPLSPDCVDTFTVVGAFSIA